MKLPEPTEKMLKTYLRFAEDSRANEALFYAWEWLQELSARHPEEAWQAFRWLAAEAPSEQVLSIIGCGPLQDFLWQHPEYAGPIIAAANSDQRFYQAARWCELDEEDVGTECVKNFESQMLASPFARGDAA